MRVWKLASLYHGCVAWGAQVVADLEAWLVQILLNTSYGVIPLLGVSAVSLQAGAQTMSSYG